MGVFVALLVLSWVVTHARMARLGSSSLFAGLSRTAVRLGGWVWVVAVCAVAANVVGTGNGSILTAGGLWVLLAGPALFVLRRMPVRSRQCRRCGTVSATRTCPTCQRRSLADAQKSAGAQKPAGARRKLLRAVAPNHTTGSTLRR